MRISSLPTDRQLDRRVVIPFSHAVSNTLKGLAREQGVDVFPGRITGNHASLAFNEEKRLAVT